MSSTRECSHFVASPLAEALSDLAFFGRVNAVLFSRPPAPLNACVIREVFFCRFIGLRFVHTKQLAILTSWHTFKSSMPPAPLNECVIRGVFLCPNLRRKEVA
jgi:hypothetical protein